MKTDARRRTLLISILLLVATLALYWPVIHYPFIDFDDPQYVTRNSRVLGGLSWDGAAWAFRSLGYAGNWHPLTWLSHMLDVQLFGLNAGGHHLVSLALHAANTILLFLVLRASTGAVGRSAVVSALFALHPLHVESVAWIAERKDVLSTFFWLGAIAAYLRYVRSPGLFNYLLVVAGFALGLLSKPMVVTLPAVLLLLDYWPLGRWKSGAAPRVSLFLEKVPLLLLAAASSAVTLVAQSRGGAMKVSGQYSLAVRLANALTSTATYLAKTFLPTDLAVYYPFPLEIPAWKWLGAAVLLGLLTAAIFLGRRAFPYLTAGWLWYLVTLLPVLGVIRVGGQAMADRYVYIPSIGLFVALVWGACRAIGRLRRKVAVLACMATLALLPLTVFAGRQIRYWRDGSTLANHALRVTTGNWAAHSILAYTSMRQGNAEAAVVHCREALAIKNLAEVRDILGVALTQLGRPDEAIAQFREAIRIDPSSFTAYNDLAVALDRQGKIMEALGYFQSALRLQPESIDVLDNLGFAYLRLGNPREAERHLTTALRLAPDSGDVHYHLAAACEMQGRYPDAARHYRETLRLMPGDAAAEAGLRRVLSRQ